MMTFGTVGPEEDRSHKPGPDDNEMWQESWALHFYDPMRRIGGYYHIGLQVPRGIADVWSWTSVEGRLVDSYQRLDLPLPSDDYTDIRVGPFHLVSTKPNMDRRLVIANGGFSATFDYRAIHDPVTFDHASGGGYGELAKGHYETIGRITGTIEWEGRSLAVDGHAYDDRSWGERDWRSMTNHRYVWAYFGEDLYMVLYDITTGQGVQQWGWVYDNGRRRAVTRLDFDLVMSSNGVTPKGCEFVAWTESGFAYRLKGVCDGGDVVTQRDGFMCAPAAMRFEHAGRVGPGIMEVSELKTYRPWIREQLGPA